MSQCPSERLGEQCSMLACWHSSQALQDGARWPAARLLICALVAVYRRYYYYSRTLEGQQYRVHCRRKVPSGQGPPSGGHMRI